MEKNDFDGVDEIADKRLFNILHAIRSDMELALEKDDFCGPIQALANCWASLKVCELMHQHLLSNFTKGMDEKDKKKHLEIASTGLDKVLARMKENIFNEKEWHHD